MPLDGFPDPFMNCCFITDNILFVSFYEAPKSIHHHFFYTIDSKEITKHTVINLNSVESNFPYSCFYNDELDEVYNFYRQG
jgi:hypothetical protein